MTGSFASSISLKETPVTIGLIALNVIMWIGLEVTGGSQDTQNLVRFGAKFGPYIAQGEWWRLVVPVFLHIGIFHLLANSFGLLIFGGMVERIFGSVPFAAVYLIAGVLGNLFSYWADIGIYDATPVGAGASGAVFGIVGAFGSYLMLNRQVLGSMGRQALTSVLFIVAINFVFGFTVRGIDNLAHLGGLLGGGLVALTIAPTQNAVIAAFTPGRPTGYVQIRTRRPSLTRLTATIAVSCLALTGLAVLIGNAYLNRLGI